MKNLFLVIIFFIVTTIYAQTPESFKYQAVFIPILIESNKEQQVQIKQLEKENNKQQEIINKLIKRIEKLETKN